MGETYRMLEEQKPHNESGGEAIEGVHSKTQPEAVEPSAVEGAEESPEVVGDQENDLRPESEPGEPLDFRENMELAEETIGDAEAEVDQALQEAAAALPELVAKATEGRDLSEDEDEREGYIRAALGLVYEGVQKIFSRSKRTGVLVLGAALLAVVAAGCGSREGGKVDPQLEQQEKMAKLYYDREAAILDETLKLQKELAEKRSEARNATDPTKKEQYEKEADDIKRRLDDVMQTEEQRARTAKQKADAAAADARFKAAEKLADDARKLAEAKNAELERKKREKERESREVKERALEQRAIEIMKERLPLLKREVTDQDIATIEKASGIYSVSKREGHIFFNFSKEESYKVTPEDISIIKGRLLEFRAVEPRTDKKNHQFLEEQYLANYMRNAIMENGAPFYKNPDVRPGVLTDGKNDKEKAAVRDFNQKGESFRMKEGIDTMREFGLTVTRSAVGWETEIDGTIYKITSKQLEVVVGKLLGTKEQKANLLKAWEGEIKTRKGILETQRYAAMREAIVRRAPKEQVAEQEEHFNLSLRKLEEMGPKGAETIQWDSTTEVKEYIKKVCEKAL